MSTVRAHYEAARALGKSRREAKRWALQQATIDAEREQVEQGISDYDRQTVRQALVHTRQDTVLVIAFLSEISEAMRSVRRWLIGVTVLLLLVVLHFLFP